MIKTFKLLSDEEIGDFKDKFLSLKWTDGKLTAGELLNKKNRQLLIEQVAPELVELLKQKLFDHQFVKALVRPKYLIRPMLNKYTVGEYYDWHFDAPTMADKRGDVSFTLFLEPPESYEGGELHLKDGDQIIEVKANPGDIVMYSTGHLHKVCEVTRGVRICVVGWIQSWIKDESARQDLLDLQKWIGTLQKNKDVDPSIPQHLAGIYNNLIRRESK